MQRAVLFFLILVCCFSLFCGCGKNDSLSSQSDFSEQNDSSDVIVIFINVGYGDSIAILCGGKCFLIDTGVKKAFSSVKGVLHGYNINTIEAVFLTHGHTDHYGGLEKLCDEFTVKKIYTSELYNKVTDKLQNAVAKVSVPHVLLKIGEKIQLSKDAFLDVLAPIVPGISGENNNSLVMMLYSCGKKVLLTGDMEYDEERTLLDSGVDLSADVLKVANHGNPDATSNRLISAVTPSFAVISTSRTEDTNSANQAVINALSPAKVYITEDFVIGVVMKISTEGISFD